MHKNQPLAILNRTLKWLDKTEGRDKFCKAIQYACRYLKFKYEQDRNNKAAKKVQALFNSMKQARKLFRLFKSFKQFSKLLEVLGKDMRIEDLILNVVTRIGFLLYWIYDNLAVLASIKVIDMKAKQLGKKGATFWFIALVSTFILTIKNLIITLQKSAKQGPQSASKTKKALHKDILTLVKTVGDMLPAGQGCEFYKNNFGFSVDEGKCGLGGLVSALISSYELFD